MPRYRTGSVALRAVLLVGLVGVGLFCCYRFYHDFVLPPDESNRIVRMPREFIGQAYGQIQEQGASTEFLSDIRRKVMGSGRGGATHIDLGLQDCVALLEMLALNGNQRSAVLLVGAINDPDEDVRTAALVALTECTSDECVATFAERVPAEEPDNPRFREILEAMVAPPSATGIRGLVALHMRLVGTSREEPSHQRALEVLREILLTGDPEATISAIDAILVQFGIDEEVEATSMLVDIRRKLGATDEAPSRR